MKYALYILAMLIFLHSGCKRPENSLREEAYTLKLASNGIANMQGEASDSRLDIHLWLSENFREELLPLIDSSLENDSDFVPPIYMEVEGGDYILTFYRERFYLFGKRSLDDVKESFRKHRDLPAESRIRFD